MPCCTRGAGAALRRGLRPLAQRRDLTRVGARRPSPGAVLHAVVAGVAGAMYAPILPPDYHMGMDFLVISFVIVVVGGMGSLRGAVAAGFLLGILQSLASMTVVSSLFPGIDQIIIYLVAVVILLTRPRGLMGRKGVMED